LKTTWTDIGCAISASTRSPFRIEHRSELAGGCINSACGYSARFHAAYGEAYPLDAGYEVRKNLYNLYHVLNHLNLFGGSYLQQAERMIDALFAET
jgi:fructosamine-3-kinase